MFPESYPCKECQAGIVHPSYVTYFTWLKDELITVPNFPAWICDVCGKREYDQHAIVWLTTLLNPNAGRSSKPRKNAYNNQQKGENLPPARPK